MLPAGWKINEKGLLEYTMFPEEVKEMDRLRNTIFILATLNVIQAIFIFIFVFLHFYNH